MDACINHEDHAAIEHCEICGDALCDLCLWYDDDGRRLCEKHARAYQDAGGSVQSPALYVEGIQVKDADDSVQRAPFEGNQTDLIAFAAGILGLASLSTWFGGTLCISISAAALGLIALTSKRRSQDTTRTQQLGFLGMGLGILGLIPLLLFFCFFTFAIGFAIAGNAGP